MRIVVIAIMVFFIVNAIAILLSGCVTMPVKVGSSFWMDDCIEQTVDGETCWGYLRHVDTVKEYFVLGSVACEGPTQLIVHRSEMMYLPLAELASFVKSKRCR